jgi:hypothetical protein
MATITISLSDELFERASAVAAARGITLEDLIIECLEDRLRQTRSKLNLP